MLKVWVVGFGSVELILVSGVGNENAASTL